jgi:uncharacterized protein YndB with AHSA1/START domain
MTAITGDAVELERYIAAPPEVVYAYFTDPDRYRQWQGRDAELDPRPGGRFRITMSGQTRTVVWGEFVEVEPPRRLVMTWGWEPQDWFPDGMRIEPGSTTVEVTFIPEGEGTRLRLRHGDLPTEAACDFHVWGWNLTLDRLVLAAEGRDPGPDPFAEM